MSDISPTQVIDQLSRLWPKDSSESELSIRTRLSGKIADKFAAQGLRAAVTGGHWKTVVPPLTNSGVCKYVVANTEAPHQIAMVEMRLQSSDWLLAAFNVQCPACFGTGVNNPRFCDLCFGVGWGVFEGEYLELNSASIAIQQLSAQWPTRLDEPEERIRQRLLGKIVDTLPSASLRTVAAGRWQIVGAPLVASGVAKCLLTDTVKSNSRVISELHESSGGWLLQAFDAECPACHGVGLLSQGKSYTAICNTCFGVGWGRR